MGDLRFRSLDLQDGDPAAAHIGGIWLDLEEGFYEPADVRGEDDVVPEASGREVGARIRDVREIVLTGHVRGQGTTAAERSSDWYTRTQALMAVMQLHSDPGVLEVDGPYLGIPEGTGYSLNARVVRVISGRIRNRMSYQTWSFQLRCIDSPPEWVEAES